MNEVAELRRFNRAYTQRIGVLDESYLATGRSLGLSRLLYEIDGEGSLVIDLRRRLGLDSGYLSRCLRRLEADGLVEVRPDVVDRRLRRVVLTSDGQKERELLDSRSESVAEGLLATLGSGQRTVLADALATARRLLCAATVQFDRVEPTDPQALASRDRYFTELNHRFSGGFDVEAAGAADDLDALSSPAGTFLLMRTDADPIGCGGVQRVDDRTGEIKRMWVDAEWRGLGLGARLLSRLEREARDLGYDRVVLDTNEVLAEAVAMYERAGYHRIHRYNDNPYAHHWFAKPLDD